VDACQDEFVLENATIIVTGATGQVGLPVARALAQQSGGGNTVWAPARFSNPAARAELEAAGVKCAVADLGTGEGYDQLPAAADYVLNFAVAKTDNSDADLTANAESVGLLMTRYKDAKAFLHCSSTAVYAPGGGRGLKEESPLGDNNHSRMMPNYVLSKVAAEAVARSYARTLDLPTIICRLNVPYGDNGGWPWYHLLMLSGGMAIPVPPDGGAYHLIHEDDIIRTLPALLAAAAVPAVTVNWAGSERVTIEEWVGYLGELTGKTPTFSVDATAIEGTPADVAKLTTLVGEPTQVSWRDGLKRMVEVRNPELLVTP
jgi:nucleoside-diphosphate-sugar epimerase